MPSLEALLRRLLTAALSAENGAGVRIQARVNRAVVVQTNRPGGTATARASQHGGSEPDADSRGPDRDGD